MIVHTLATDTRVDFVWTDDDDEPITIVDFELLIDAVDQAALITVSAGLLALHIPFDLDLDAGNRSYSLRANNGTDWTLLSAGLLRVRS